MRFLSVTLSFCTLVPSLPFTHPLPVGTAAPRGLTCWCQHLGRENDTTYHRKPEAEKVSKAGCSTREGTEQIDNVALRSELHRTGGTWVLVPSRRLSLRNLPGCMASPIEVSSVLSLFQLPFNPSFF